MVHVLGIRHHGPGSARNVRSQLEALQPDIVLVEGPPEADDILRWADHAELKPPVAILVFQPDDPESAVFYPFAEFSPEWQAIQYAKEKKIPVRFMDLPLAHCLAIEKEKRNENQEENTSGVLDVTPLNDYVASAGSYEVIIIDPISQLAAAAGFEDGEQWWEQQFEQRLQNEAVFDAVSEAMHVLREELPRKDDRMERLREAYMRKIVRQAEKEMFTNITVVCGAWHVPALVNMPKQKEDNDLLKGLPKVKTDCTWIPWTYDRLGYFSGYGAGITSPGWYQYLWHHPQDDGTRWFAGIAQLFRSKNMDVSVAHVIEAVRLAENLAAIRNYPRPGLQEMNEAALTVICGGEPILLQLIKDELVVSNKIGEVPAEIPKPPLQLDIEKQQKKLRLVLTADFKDYMLDLRKENDLERSIFLHRLLILDIDWGSKSYVSGKGTFKEQWRLQWRPELSIAIIEKGTWGNTLEEAASAYVLHRCKEAKNLLEVTTLLEELIPADLSKAAEHVAVTINNMAAATNDVLQLVKIIPGLAGVVRYGNVRQTDAGMILQLLSSMITRVAIGLPPACIGIDEETATSLTDDCNSIQHSIQLLQQQEFVQQWQYCLQQVADNRQTAPMLKGFAVRQLMDYKILEEEKLYNAFYSSLSVNVPPIEAAAWLEGFLKGSGTVLLLDDALWKMVDDWVKQLEGDAFTQVLPLLRRTFANFSPAERRKMGEKAKHLGGSVTTKKVQVAIDEERAVLGVAVVMELMGYGRSTVDH